MDTKAEKTNRQYKDSVFVDLFAHDISAKDNFLALYNALHNTHYTRSETHIENIQLEKVLYMNF